MYAVKEMFYTIQGEGLNVGRVAVFCRFSGCNLWNGQAESREDAVCTFCDTDFVGIGPDGARFSSAGDLADTALRHWRQRNGASGRTRPLIVCTGGEPLLQLDQAAVDALHDRGFEVAVETNGTCVPPSGIDHVCVSPKADAPLKLLAGQELKLVYPQLHAAAQPERFEHLMFDHFFLQPMDGPSVREHTAQAIDYCLSHPRWRLSLQTHKIAGIR